MKRWKLWATTLLPCAMLCGCVASVPNDAALCDATAGLRTDHAAALAAGADDAALVSGARLITAIDAACQ